MPDSANSRKELPNTYVIQDRNTLSEVTRLVIQDQMVTDVMGGPLAEQPDLARFHNVLDVGCGTGGWLTTLAKTYPSISRLVGVDANSSVIEYAIQQAQQENLSDRLHFQKMDVLLMLNFPGDSFDLVNLRFGLSFLRKWDWDKLLKEFRRVLRPGGIVRISEVASCPSNSQALN